MYCLLLIFLLNSSNLSKQLEDELGFLKESSKEHNLLLPTKEKKAAYISDSVSTAQAAPIRKNVDEVSDKLLSELEEQESKEFKKLRKRSR